MGTDYEQFYQQHRHGLGGPTAEYVSFFKEYSQKSATVLDVGCGQGRDALFIARLGHRVTAIDLSATGIEQLREDAIAENLAIEAIVADVLEYDWRGEFDIVLIDRTLHMFPRAQRLQLLRDLLLLTKAGSYLLIADEPSNIGDFREVLRESAWNWSDVLARKGYLFVRRELLPRY